MGRRQKSVVLTALLFGLGLFLAQPKSATAAAVGLPAVPPKVTLDVPNLYLEGEPFPVTLTVQAPQGEFLELPTWSFTAEAFQLGKRALGPRRSRDPLRLHPEQTISTTVDLAPLIAELELDPAPFEITWAGIKDIPAKAVLWLEAAEKGIEFMELPTAQLADYEVALQTNRGLIWIKLWPDVAPDHVRNYLDLAYTGFYDGTSFHRVVPGFMIQGGRAKEGEQAPRKVKAEFNTKRHVRGVLSMARLDGQNDSADSEFFLMHAENAQLDGNYTAFGETVQGLEVIDAIVMTGDRRYSPRTPQGYTPTTPQIIQRAVVIKAPEPKR